MFPTARIKLVGWKRQVTTALLLPVALASMITLVRAAAELAGIAGVNPPTPSPSASAALAMECPDRIEHDSSSLPLWVKGSEQVRITGETEARLMDSCTGLRPTPTPPPSATPSTTPSPVVPATPSPTSTPAPVAKKSTVPSPKPSPTKDPTVCVSNASPVFTHHLIDPAQVTNILPPPNIAEPSGHLKTHSYIDTPSPGIPLYAPADMVLIKGDYYTGGPYYLDFRVTCQVMLRLAHVIDPIDAIKNAFGADPEAAGEIEIKPPLVFKAGDLIAHSGGPPHVLNNGLDFGVYNSTKPNRYTQTQTSSIYTTAVCPYDYFTTGLREAYRAKFNLVDHNSMNPDGESFCQ